MIEVTEGPKLRAELTCIECKYCDERRYSVQGDNGKYVWCTFNGSNLGITSKYIGDTNWHTPDWCPLLPPSIVIDDMKTLTKKD